MVHQKRSFSDEEIMCMRFSLTCQVILKILNFRRSKQNLILIEMSGCKLWLNQTVLTRAFGF